MKPGDKVIICIDMSGGPANMTEYVITKVGKDTVQCGDSENTFYRAACWPIEYKDKLAAVLAERARLKAAYDDSFKLVIELRNEIARAGKD